MWISFEVIFTITDVTQNLNYVDTKLMVTVICLYLLAQRLHSLRPSIIIEVRLGCRWHFAFDYCPYPLLGIWC